MCHPSVKLARTIDLPQSHLNSLCRYHPTLLLSYVRTPTTASRLPVFITYKLQHQILVQ